MTRSTLLRFDPDEIRRRTTSLEGVGALLAVPVVGFVGGPPGIVVGVLLAVCVSFVDAPIPFALAQFVPVLFDLTPAELVALEVVFVPLLLGPLSRTGGGVRLPVLAAVSFVVLSGVMAFVATSLSGWVASVVTLAVVGFVGYGLHRYELVRLGLTRAEQ